MPAVPAGPDASTPPSSVPASSAATAPPRPDGLVLSPFRAVRYDPRRVDLASVTAPPYDVIDADGREALEQSSPQNVVRLILPRDGSGEGDRYARAADTLRQWRSDGVLLQDEIPALYVYEQAGKGHAQRGLVGALALTPPEDGIVLPHESTMSDTVSDRLALYTAVEADLEPVFLVYAGGGAATEAVASADQREPVVDAVLADGLRHRVWAITDPAELAAIAEDLSTRTALIADGHHRYATYLQRQRQAHAEGRGAGPWDRGMVLLVDTTSFGPEVHPIHRVVSGRSAAELCEGLEAVATVEDLDGRDLEAALGALARAGSRGPSYLLASGDAAVLRLIAVRDRDALHDLLPEHSEEWRRLDVSVLHHLLVQRTWGLPDEPGTVGYEHDVPAALRRAAEIGGAAVLLNPTSAEAVAAVASNGERMPRKSTLFTPKPRSGLLLRSYDG